MEYFRINFPKDMNLAMLVRFILIKEIPYNPHLRFLSLHISNANENTVHERVKLIDSEK